MQTVKRAWNTVIVRIERAAGHHTFSDGGASDAPRKVSTTNVCRTVVTVNLSINPAVICHLLLWREREEDRRDAKLVGMRRLHLRSILVDYGSVSLRYVITVIGVCLR